MKKDRHKVMVYCKKCDELKDESTVDSIDIEETLEGWDLLTFRCPKCGTISKSLRRG